MRTGILMLACLVTTAIPERSRVGQTNPEEFVVGILHASVPRSDLQIEPLARFTGSTWVNSWPAASDPGAPLPALSDATNEWLGKPIPREWTVWSGGRSASVSATKLVQDPDGCSTPIVLALDKTAEDLGFKKDYVIGLAFDRRMAAEPVRKLAPVDPEWRQLKSAIENAFRQNRKRLVDASPMDSPEKHAVSESRMSSIEVSIDHVYAPIGSTAPLVYYFEASQRSEKDDAFAPHVSMRGWLRRNAAGQWTATSIEGALEAGDEYGPAGEARQRPIGLFRLPGRAFWVLQGHGYEWIYYTLYEVNGEAVRLHLAVNGGGC